MKPKELVLAIGVISFVALVICLIMLLGNKLAPETCGGLDVIQESFVYIFIFFTSVFIGCFVYYLLSLKIAVQQNIINKNIKMVMDFLDDDERKVLKEIINANGLMLQSELTQKFGKLKTHRIIRRLQQKNVVTISDIGKTNEIKIKPELKKK